MAVLIAPPNLLLPWSSTSEDDRRYWKIFGWLLIPFLVLSIAIPLIKIPEPDREDLEKLPPQLARVVIEEQQLPTPIPTPPPEPEPKKEEPEKKPTPEPEPEPKPEPKPTPEPAKLVEKAREKAEAEINQFADALSEMRDSFDLSDVNANDLTQSTGEAAELDRAIIASQANKGSGGINTKNLSRNTGGIALSGKESTRVTSKIATSSGTGNTASRKAANASGGASRSVEDIRKIMEQSKAAIFNVYNRALRRNPTLEGRVIFKIVIEASGKVSKVDIVSSELNDPDLEHRLVARIMLINFGSMPVETTTTNYTLNFFPAG